MIAIHFGAESLELHAKVARFRDYAVYFVLFYQLGIWQASATSPPAVNTSPMSNCVQAFAVR